MLSLLYSTGFCDIPLQSQINIFFQKKSRTKDYNLAVLQFHETNKYGSVENSRSLPKACLSSH